MVGFTHVATYRAPQSVFTTNLTDVTIGRFDGQLVLYSATHADGGIARWTLGDAADGLLNLAEVSGYAAITRHDSAPGLVLLDRPGGGASLLTTGLFGGGDISRELAADGALGAFDSGVVLAPLPVDMNGAAQFATARGASFLATVRRGDTAITTWQMQDDGRLALRSTSERPPNLPPDAQIDNLISVEVNGNPLVISVSARGNFVASHTVRPDGSLGGGTFLGSASGTGFDQPRDVVAVQTAAGDFLVVGSAGSSSLSVLRLSPDGRMNAVDHVLDERGTRFQGATAMDAVTLDGRGFVIVGGADDGLSLFTLTPQGQLLHLSTIADADDMSIADVSSIDAEVVDGRIVVFVTSATESGISQFVVDPGRLGATITGGAGVVLGTLGDDMMRASADTTVMKGGAGNDIMIAGTASVAMDGGPGSDLFVPTALTGRIAIRDFNPDQDMLDFSMLGMVRSVEQLIFRPQAGGVRIIYGDTVLDIRSVDGSTLTARDFDNALFPIAHYALEAVQRTLMGTARDDVLTAPPDGARILGLAGNDTLVGSAFADFLIGGPGHDIIRGGLGDDTLWGISEDDRLLGGAGHDVVLAGSGNNLVLGDEGNDTLSGEDGNDTLWGGADNDFLNGGAGVDFVDGGLGDDTLLGMFGADLLFGGPGDDVLIDRFGANEMKGGEGNDQLTAGNWADRLFGNAGNDSIAAGGGNDTIFCGDGDDRVFAQAGNDLVLAGTGNDLILGGDGNDWLWGEAGDDWLAGLTGADRLNGGDGHDRMEGGTGADTLWGGSGNDTLTGDDGDDDMYGGTGHDLMLGGAGNDRLNGWTGNDMLIGGAGADMLAGFGHDDMLEGGDGDDRLFGGDGNDVLLGGNGRDNLQGGMDDDRLSGGADNDTLNGEAGADLLEGGDGDDLLIGLWHDDTLIGDAGADTMFGGYGNDQLWGGDGDVLIGGDGADQFVFTAPDSGAGLTARLTDFQSGLDRIDLSRMALVYVGDAAFTGAGQARVQYVAGGALLQADLDGDGVADMVLTLVGVTALHGGDLIMG